MSDMRDTMYSVNPLPDMNPVPPKCPYPVFWTGDTFLVWDPSFAYDLRVRYRVVPETLNTRGEGNASLTSLCRFVYFPFLFLHVWLTSSCVSLPLPPCASCNVADTSLRLFALFHDA